MSKVRFSGFQVLVQDFGQNWKFQNPQIFCFDLDFLCPKSSLVADFDPSTSAWKHFLRTRNLAHKVDPSPEVKFSQNIGKT